MTFYLIGEIVSRYTLVPLGARGHYFKPAISAFQAEIAALDLATEMLMKLVEGT